MKLIHPMLFSFFTGLILSVPAYAEDDLMVSSRNLTLSTAIKIAQAAIVECTKKGIQIGVTVVDRQGVVQVTLRDTIAAPITLPISKGKAFTAVNFNAPHRPLETELMAPLAVLPVLLCLPGVYLSRQAAHYSGV